MIEIENYRQFQFMKVLPSVKRENNFFLTISLFNNKRTKISKVESKCSDGQILFYYIDRIYR